MRLEANLGVPANLSKIPATERRPLFVSHSTDDRPGQLFLAQVFGAVDSVWRPVYYSVEGPRAPHAGSILKHLETAGALVVLLSPELAERKHTQSWVAFEVGAAARICRQTLDAARDARPPRAISRIPPASTVPLAAPRPTN